VQESSADQAALSMLRQTHQSPRGMLQFFEKLGDQEALLTASQDPYVRTHPLTRNRVDTIRAAVARSPYADVDERPVYVVRHARMKAKLIAFLRSPVETLRIYPAGAGRTRP
jgi:predicted Zn-dependent protease